MRAAGLIALALYALGLLGDSYWGLIEDVPGLSGVYNAIFALMGYTRNGLFFAPLFMWMGCALRQGRPRFLPDKAAFEAAGLAGSLLLMLAEGLTLMFLGWQRHDSMYIMLPAVMYFLFAAAAPRRGRGRAAPRRLLAARLHPPPPRSYSPCARRRAYSGCGISSLSTASGITPPSALAAPPSPPLLLAAWAKVKPRRVSDTARAWVEVDLDAIRRNAAALQEASPEGCRLMAVLKCDAYGHGARRSALELERMGVKAFAVACCAEGVELRRAGVRGLILILGYTPVSQWRVIRRYRLTQCAVDSAYARALNEGREGKPVEVHIKVDTGMHRLGESWEHADAIAGCFSLPRLRVTGMFTHLCVSDSLSEGDVAFTETQIERFFSLAAGLRARGIDPGALHTQASYGLINYPDARCAYARAGVALYGVKSDEHDGLRSLARPGPGAEPQGAHRPRPRVARRRERRLWPGVHDRPAQAA